MYSKNPKDITLLYTRYIVFQKQKKAEKFHFVLLKFENLVLGVSKLLEDATDRALLHTILFPRDRNDLSRRAYSAPSHNTQHTQKKKEERSTPINGRGE